MLLQISTMREYSANQRTAFKISYVGNTPEIGGNSEETPMVSLP